MELVTRDKVFADTQRFIQSVSHDLPEAIGNQLGSMYESLTVENAADIYDRANDLVDGYYKAQKRELNMGAFKVSSGVILTGLFVWGAGWLGNRYLDRDADDESFEWGWAGSRHVTKEGHTNTFFERVAFTGGMITFGGLTMLFSIGH